MLDRGKIDIRAINAANSVPAIKAFRKATDATIAHIRNSIAQNAPIATAQLYDGDHDQSVGRLLTLLRELDELGIAYEIIIDGVLESRQYLLNILERWRKSGIESRMVTNLEIGEPDIDTLVWLQRNSPGEVCRLTLEQIVNCDNCKVDGETLAWVRQQLEIT